MDVVASATGGFRAILLPVLKGRTDKNPLSSSLRSTSEIDLSMAEVAVRILAVGGASKLVAGPGWSAT